LGAEAATSDADFQIHVRGRNGLIPLSLVACELALPRAGDLRNTCGTVHPL